MYVLFQKDRSYWKLAKEKSHLVVVQLYSKNENNQKPKRRKVMKSKEYKTEMKTGLKYSLAAGG